MHPKCIMILHLQTNYPIKWRIIKHFTFLYLVIIQCLIGMFLHHPKYHIMGIESLNPHLAFLSLSTGSTRDLLQHLICSFVRSKVRLVKKRIGIQHSHQTYIIEMQPFSNHLRSNEDIAFMTSEGINDFFIRILVSRGIEIHAQHARFRK